MKSIVTFAMLAAVATFTADAYAQCAPTRVINKANALAQASMNLAIEVDAAAAAVPFYQPVSIWAGQLGEHASALAMEARGLARCAPLKNTLERHVRTAFQELKRAMTQAQSMAPLPPVRAPYNHLVERMRMINAEFDLDKPCSAFVGTYTGTCRSSAGVTPLSFTVTESGGACVMSQTGFSWAQTFSATPTTPSVRLLLAPRSGAFNYLNVTISASGGFALSGKNEAGNFWFTCN